MRHVSYIVDIVAVEMHYRVNIKLGAILVASPDCCSRQRVTFYLWQIAFYEKLYVLEMCISLVHSFSDSTLFRMA